MLRNIGCMCVPFVHSAERGVGASAREGLTATEVVLVLERYYF